MRTANFIQQNCCQLNTGVTPALQNKGKDEGGHARGKSRCDLDSTCFSNGGFLYPHTFTRQFTGMITSLG